MTIIRLAVIGDACRHIPQLFSVTQVGNSRSKKACIARNNISKECTWRNTVRHICDVPTSSNILCSTWVKDLPLVSMAMLSCMSEKAFRCTGHEPAMILCWKKHMHVNLMHPSSYLQRNLAVIGSGQTKQVHRHTHTGTL